MTDTSNSRSSLERLSWVTSVCVHGVRVQGVAGFPRDAVKDETRCGHLVGQKLPTQSICLCVTSVFLRRATEISIFSLTIHLYCQCPEGT